MYYGFDFSPARFLETCRSPIVGAGETRVKDLECVRARRALPNTCSGGLLFFIHWMLTDAFLRHVSFFHASCFPAAPNAQHAPAAASEHAQAEDPVKALAAAACAQSVAARTQHRAVAKPTGASQPVQAITPGTTLHDPSLCVGLCGIIPNSTRPSTGSHRGWACAVFQRRVVLRTCLNVANGTAGTLWVSLQGGDSCITSPATSSCLPTPSSASSLRRPSPRACPAHGGAP